MWLFSADPGMVAFPSVILRPEDIISVCGSRLLLFQGRVLKVAGTLSLNPYYGFPKELNLETD